MEYYKTRNQLVRLYIMILKNKNYNIKIFDSDSYNNYNFNQPIDKEKLYNTELILITNSNNLKELLYWLYWHINVIGFEHVVLIDNSKENLIQPFISKFGNSITYIKKPGVISQCEIYNYYVKNSKSKWVLPLDDDEYLYISDKFDHSINTFIKKNDLPVYKYAFNWHMMFNDTIIEKNNDFYVNLYQSECPIDYVTFDCFWCVKTMVNTEINHLYVSDNGETPFELKLNNLDMDKNYRHIDSGFSLFKVNHMGSVHNPISKVNNTFRHAYNYNTDDMTIGLFCNNKERNRDIYIAHYKYRDLDSIKFKINNFHFTDIMKQYINDAYNLDNYYNAFNIIRPSLIKNDDLYNLSNEFDLGNKVKAI